MNVLKLLLGPLNKLKYIIQGWYYWAMDINGHISRPRMKVCNKPCDENKLGVCKICGCVLKAKTRIKKEVCPLEKW